MPKGWPDSHVDELKLVIGLDPPLMANGREYPRVYRMATRDTPVFTLPKGEAFHVYQQNTRRLPYTLRSPGGEHVLVIPTYPQYGFLRLKYDTLKPKGPHAVLAEDMDSRTSSYGKVVQPGLAHFGPLAVGRYRLVLYVGRVRGVNPTKTIEGLDLRPGLNEYEWVR